MNCSDNLIIGTIDAANGSRDYVSIDAPARDAHTWLLGRTRQGKSTAIKNWIIQDLAAGRGCAFFDPHGDIVASLIDYVPPNRAHQLVYITGDSDRPVAFNILDGVDERHRPLVAQQVLSAFVGVWGRDAIGPQSTEVLLMSLRLLLDAPGTTLLCIPALLTTPTYRARLYRTLRDPVVMQYWQSRFDVYDEKARQEITRPLQNKLSAVLAVPAFRNIVAQPKSTIHMRRIMDEKRILVINLSKGALGEQTSFILGAMLTTALTTAAMSRENISQEKRIPFYAYFDEFQNYASASFETILSEAAKYRLAITVANQHTEQLPPPVLSALLANVATIITYRIAAPDAEIIAPHIRLKPIIDTAGMGEHITTAVDQLTRLPRYTAIAALEQDGVPLDPLQVDMLPEPPPRGSPEHRARLLKNSASRHGRDRAEVEEQIARFLKNHQSSRRA